MKNKKTKFREFELESENKIFLGKDEKSNDELMKKYKGKENIIMHTSSPGSPFGVIENLNPSKEEIYLSGSIVASYSQDWRDNKKDVMIDIFTGKDISKRFWMKKGTWKVKKSKKIKIKKQDIKNANNRK
jgi:predicted ribosome quality control (RQC) complex YloA/Tae2 family protein